mgnify:CR=1 FL=1
MVQRQNKALALLFVTNIIVLVLLGVINAKLGQFGVFLYLPGLFFLPGALYLDNLRGIPLAFTTGLLLDQQLECAFGFHAFALTTLHLLGTRWVRGISYRRELMPLLLQLPANLLLFLLLLGWVKILENGSQDWKMARWGSDLMFSTLLLVPLAIWVPRFTNSLLEIVRLSPLGDEKLS